MSRTRSGKIKKDLDDDSMKFNLNLCIVLSRREFLIQLMTFSSVIRKNKARERELHCEFRLKGKREILEKSDIA